MIGIDNPSAFSSEKIKCENEACQIMEEKKKEGKRVGMCHGGFDLLHPGHALHFASAKKHCDILVVSVTSDRFVSSRKGEGRPIFNERLRAYMIACLEAVDYVVITDSKTAVDPIRSLKPSFYIKGKDYIAKQTPGITAEREAIKAVGGETIYMTDPKLGTTEIIAYIKDHVKKSILVCIDRDGTLIRNDDFFGKEDSWQKDIRYNDPLIAFLLYLKTTYNMTAVIVSNQAGIARGYFTEGRVREINAEIEQELVRRGIPIDTWEYCPDVEVQYAKAHPEIHWQKAHVKEYTRRKPGTAMVDDALKRLGKERADYGAIMVIGDREEDENLAKNLDAQFFRASAAFSELLSLLRQSP